MAAARSDNRAEAQPLAPSAAQAAPATAKVRIAAFMPTPDLTNPPAPIYGFAVR
jgi:hypothetical protein